MLRPFITALLMAPLLALNAWAADVRELTWSEMVPPDAPVATQPAAPMHDISQLADALAAEQAPAAKQQSPAAPVVPALDGQEVRLPGYIVPLEVSEQGRVTEFLLVPYFGACIHVPPPPSNQIVHVTSELGVLMDALYQPFWVEGPLQVKSSSSELADAGYQMDANKIYPYETPES